MSGAADLHSDANLQLMFATLLGIIVMFPYHNHAKIKKQNVNELLPGDNVCKICLYGILMSYWIKRNTPLSKCGYVRKP